MILISVEELQAIVDGAVSKALSKFHFPKEEAVREILTVQEAAAFLSMSKWTLYGKVSRLEIPFRKKGKLYFRRSELEAWLEDERHQTKEEIEANGIKSKRKGVV